MTEAPPAGARPFYGWTAIVPSVFVVLLVTNGLTLGGMAAFDPTLIAQLGGSRADVKFGDFIQLGVTAVMTVGSGWLADRHGVRPVMILGILALAAGFFGLGRVDSLSDLYWARFLMGLGLAGAGLAICVVAVSRWFILRRGLALGLVLAGTSLGNGFFPRIFTALIADEGLRTAADIAACAVLAMALLVIVLKGETVKAWMDMGAPHVRRWRERRQKQPLTSPPDPAPRNRFHNLPPPRPGFVARTAELETLTAEIGRAHV